MDIFDCHYFKLNKRLLSMVGQWPYQDPRTRFIRRSFVTFVVVSFMFFQLSVLATTDDVFYFAIEVVPQILVVTTCLLKMYTSFFNAKTMEELLNRMNVDWTLHESDPQEIEIIRKYAFEGKIFTLAYAGVVYSNVLLFFCVPFTSALLDIIAPLNTSRPRTNLVEAEYFVDGEKYFYPICVHTCFVVFIAMTVYVAADAMLIVYVQHACAIFAIVGHRLEHSIRRDGSDAKDSLEATRRILKLNLVTCIDTHRRAIRYAELIESSYTRSFFLQLVSNVVNMSATLLRILTLLDHFEDALRYVGYAFAQLLHMFIGAYAGQLLMDHSVRISDSLYNGEWYDLPVEIQKFLLLVLRRGGDPCYLTAGKVFVLSVATFSGIVQASMSYFTVLSSVI